jgi:arylsulfatase A-like enzyme
MRLLPLGGAFLTCLLAATSTQADLPQKPNIIVIFADDLGFGDTGAYNQINRCGQGLPCIQTPRIDQMAAEGMRFINMYSCGPECSPARGGLMTGFHTGHATIRINGEYLRREDITVAEVLKRGGYATALIGKWGIGTISGQTSPERKGFDLGYGYLENVHAWEHYTDFLYRNGVVESIPENSGSPGSCTQEVVFTQDLFTNEALAFISSHTTMPFYLQLSYIIPHKWNVSPDLFSYGSESWPTIEKHFAAQVTYLDRDMGRILDRLDQLGIADRTLVIFTSDNGRWRFNPSVNVVLA